MQLQERIDLKKADRNELYCLEPPFPRTNFLIETSNACNHKCIFCAYQKMTRKVNMINPETVTRVLQQAYDLGTREVGLYATGEPFLVKELPDYVAKAKEIGYEYVYLTSNGAPATPERIRAVVDAGVDSIKFSINAPERELYEFIHGYDDFDLVMENLKYLNQYRQESGKKYKIFVTGILTRFTEYMKDEFQRVFGNLADEIVFKNVYNQGGYMHEIEGLLKCYSDDESFRRCNLPFDAICVTCEGYLSVENADYENMLVVADLNKVNLKEGWYGENMKRVRQAFIDDKLDGLVCDGCVHHEIRPSSPVMPELAARQSLDFSDSVVADRINKFNPPKLVYVPMVADILHPGHINIIKEAGKYGNVMVGLYSDEAVKTYKKPPTMSYEMRKTILENVKGVSYVVKQNVKDYEPNLRKFKPDFMVHGTDWRTGPLAEVRARAIATMGEWGGEVIEPEYTAGVSSTAIKQKMEN
ncbi:MAG: radical SAM protein [Oscillospiraceae bacterium]|nr:radical SAM protein [Oscillospiraceae bacterium]